jgi:hypothetical protein
MITQQDRIFLKNKQKELGLTDEQCNKVIAFLNFGFTFSDAEDEFYGYVLEILDKEFNK